VVEEEVLEESGGEEGRNGLELACVLTNINEDAEGEGRELRDSGEPLRRCAGFGARLAPGSLPGLLVCRSGRLPARSFFGASTLDSGDRLLPRTILLEENLKGKYRTYAGLVVGFGMRSYVNCYLCCTV
jgi:hypothetical protein